MKHLRQHVLAQAHQGDIAPKAMVSTVVRSFACVIWKALSYSRESDGAQSAVTLPTTANAKHQAAAIATEAASKTAAPNPPVPLRAHRANRPAR